MSAFGRSLVRLLAMALVAALSLQLYFLGRVALMAVVDPRSTTFQRSEAWRLLGQARPLVWQQPWADQAHISANLKRAVIASEDAGFAVHRGVEWDALEKAWARNQQAEARTARAGARLRRPGGSPATHLPDAPAPGGPPPVGGSTITQQLAKNLFLSSERTLSRKAQEFAITLALEACLPKARLLEIYLNSAEWGEGVFGAEAAAQHYFHVDAAHIGTVAAARLAVMLPAPKRFETRPASPYVVGRAATVTARMGGVVLP